MLIIRKPYGYYSYSHQVSFVICACCPFTLSAFASVQPQFVRLFVCGQRSLSFPHTIFFNGNTYLFLPALSKPGLFYDVRGWGAEGEAWHFGVIWRHVVNMLFDALWLPLRGQQRRLWLLSLAVFDVADGIILIKLDWAKNFIIPLLVLQDSVFVSGFLFFLFFMCFIYFTLCMYVCVQEIKFCAV